jgi:hypothetical protein
VKVVFGGSKTIVCCYVSIFATVITARLSPECT